MSIKNLKNDFKKGVISKKEFIESMHNYHINLKSISEEIENTEIEKIEIIKNKVLFYVKSPGKLKPSIFDVDLQDKREPPVEAFNFCAYEDQDSKMINKLAENCKIIFDIGANIGWYSIQFALCESKFIYAFEPVKSIFQKLEQNIKLNALNNIYSFNAGLSDKNMEADIYYDPNLTGASSLKGLNKNYLEKIKCKFLKLDDFLYENNVSKVDFLKIDVEGNELNVIKGGLNCIKSNKPILFLELLRKWAKEFNYHPNDVVKILDEIGYDCYVTKENGLIKILEVNDHTESTNFFFLNRKTHVDLINKFKI